MKRLFVFCLLYLIGILQFITLLFDSIRVLTMQRSLILFLSKSFWNSFKLTNTSWVTLYILDYSSVTLRSLFLICEIVIQNQIFHFLVLNPGRKLYWTLIDEQSQSRSFISLLISWWRSCCWFWSLISCHTLFINIADILRLLIISFKSLLNI